jgi:hypothetical protein
MRPGCLALLCFALVACQASGPTYAQDVKPILDGRCANCHTAGGIAPFALDNYADAKSHAAVIADAVQESRMPPWRAGAADVTYLRNPSLSDEQKAILVAWAKNGAPEGDAAKPGAPLPGVGGGMERVDLSLEMSEAYTPTVRPDDYRCFVLRWPRSAPTYVTGVNTLPGVPAQVHHVALYVVPPDSAELPAQWDAEDATPGYSCFGGPFGSRPQTFAVNLLTAWIPGYQGTTFPRGGGVLVEPGATIVMQLHYNLNNLPSAQADQTEVQFQLADAVTRRLAYQPMLDVAWVAGQMKIPANTTDVTHQYVADPRSFFKLLGSPLDTTNGFNLEAVMFHMHQLGKRGELWLEKADHRRIKVLDIPNWDFHWQNEYQLAEPLRFEPGDMLRVKCTFDNVDGRWGPGIPSRETNWGEGSTEEMCVANILSSE